MVAGFYLSLDDSKDEDSVRAVHGLRHSIQNIMEQHSQARGLRFVSEDLQEFMWCSLLVFIHG